MRHVGIDLACQLDESRLLAVLSGQPRQLERIDRDAVSAETRARVERLEAEGFGLRRLNDFPHVDSDLVVEDLELVDEGDVHRAIGVLEDLAGLGDLHARRTDDIHNGMAVQRTGSLAALLVESANHLWNRRGLKMSVARVLALRAEREKVVRSALQPGRFEQREDLFASRCWIGGALKNDQLARAKSGGDGRRGALDETQIGVAALIERRRNADDDAVGL